MKHRIFSVLLLLLTFHALAWADEAPKGLYPIAGETLYVGKDSPSAPVRITFGTTGRVPITRCTYVIQDGTKVSEERTIEFKEPVTNALSREVYVDVPPAKTIGETSVMLTVVTVNGFTNRHAYPFTNITRRTLTKQAKRKVVVEDYTGQWCPNCTHAIAAMEEAKRLYPNAFVGISVHYRDPMEIDDYATLRTKVKGYPTLKMNRDNNTQIGGNSFVSTLERLVKQGCDVDVEVQANWTDDTHTSISVESKTTFRYSTVNPPYKLAYVLTADSVVTSEYQKNNLSGATSFKGESPEIDAFISKPYYIKGLANNGVATATLGIDKGLDNSVEIAVIADEELPHRVTFENVGHHQNIQHKNKLNVCALLIDTNTGNIINAAQAKVEEPLTTGIAQTPTQAFTDAEVARYSIDGKRLSTPQKGINIIRSSDGKVVKAIVK